MAVEVTMPKFGLTMTEGTIQKWFKNEGDAIKAGEALFEVETEKVLYEVECRGTGTVAKLLYPIEAVVAVGLPVAVIAEAGENVAEVAARYGGSAPTTQSRRNSGCCCSGQCSLSSTHQPVVVEKVHQSPLPPGSSPKRIILISHRLLALVQADVSLEKMSKRLLPIVRKHQRQPLLQLQPWLHLHHGPLQLQRRRGKASRSVACARSSPSACTRACKAVRSSRSPQKLMSHN